LGEIERTWWGGKDARKGGLILVRESLSAQRESALGKKRGKKSTALVGRKRSRRGHRKCAGPKELCRLNLREKGKEKKP